MKLGKRILLKEPEIKEEKPFSGEEPELVAGKVPVEGGAGSKLGCSEHALGKGLGIHQMHFIAHIRPWSEAKNPSSAALIGFNLCFLNCKRSSTSGDEEHWEPGVGCLQLSKPPPHLKKGGFWLPKLVCTINRC